MNVHRGLVVFRLVMRRIGGRAWSLLKKKRATVPQVLNNRVEENFEESVEIAVVPIQELLRQDSFAKEIVRTDLNSGEVNTIEFLASLDDGNILLLEKIYEAKQCPNCHKYSLERLVCHSSKRIICPCCVIYRNNIPYSRRAYLMRLFFDFWRAGNV